MKKYILCTVFATALLITLPVEASTTISSQTLSGDVVWTKQGSPYIITNDHLEVEEGSSLTINPGVTVKSDGAYMQVFGTLIAEGTSEEHVLFTSLTDSEVDGWTARGLYFENTSSSSSLKYVDMRYSSDGMYFKNTSGVLSNISIKNSRQGITLDKSDFKIERFNASHLYNPLFLYQGSKAEVVDSKIENQKEGHGVVVDDSILEMRNTMVIVSEEGGGAFTLRKATTTLDSMIIKGDGAETGIGGGESILIVSSSTISNFEMGIALTSTHATIINSYIGDNVIGIYEHEPGGSVLTFVEKVVRVGLSLFGASDAYAEEVSLIHIDNSIIKNNTIYGIENLSTNTIDARNNFWGEESGPEHPALNIDGKGNKVSDGVLFDPWIGKSDVKKCCSSVVFIPGLEASRLYLVEKTNSDITTNKLWEPIRNADVEKLYLDSSGESINKNIYTISKNGDRGVIDEAFGSNVYKKFMDSMDSFVADGDNHVKEFKVLPYDWRKDIEDVANEMVGYVIITAEKSNNKKVTLVAHSNGGLVGKIVIEKLRQQGREDIVENFVMVAVPQLGSPVAVAGLLHGDQQELPGGIGFITKSTMRKLGENMKSAYTLLPSVKYFEKIKDPIATFDSTVSQIFDHKIYGDSINSFSELKDFMTATGDKRTKPSFGDTQTPNVVLPSLINLATSRHDILDSWQAPTSTKVTQIAGWGVDTIGSIEYSVKRKLLCIGSSCLRWDRKPIFVKDGDETVVSPSALTQSGDTYYLNLRDYNSEILSGLGGLRRNRKHSDILEVGPLQSFIKNIVIGSTSTLPSHLSTYKPLPKIEDRELSLDVHSPVSIGITDQAGNYTGISVSTTSEFPQIKEEIPNSYYLEFGEGKYVGVTGNENYQIKLKGTGSGTFTLNVEEKKDERKIIKSFIDIPVSTSTIAIVTNTSNIASTTLKIDMNGDGVYEKEIKPDFNSIQFLKELKQKIIALKLTSKWEKEIIAGIDKIINFLESNKNPKHTSIVAKYLESIDQKIQKIEERKRQKKEPETKDLQGIKDQLILFKLL